MLLLPVAMTQQKIDLPAYNVAAYMAGKNFSEREAMSTNNLKEIEQELQKIYKKWIGSLMAF